MFRPVALIFKKMSEEKIIDLDEFEYSEKQFEKEAAQLEFDKQPAKSFETPTDVFKDKDRIEKSGEGHKNISTPKKLGSKNIKSNQIKAIEGILSENFKDLYSTLPDNYKKVFRLKGQVAAQKIVKELENKKIKPKNIFVIIKEWLFSLKRLPGFNWFFYQQKAKIETDRIIKESKDIKK